MVVMDVFTRCMIGFSVEHAPIDGVGRMPDAGCLITPRLASRYPPCQCEVRHLPLTN